MGALTRDFFYIGFQAVGTEMFKDRKMMEGRMGHMIPSNAHDHKAFLLLGKMIGHAVVNGVRGMHGMSPAIVHYIVKGTNYNSLEESRPPISIDDVADEGLRNLLLKVRSKSIFKRNIYC